MPLCTAHKACEMLGVSTDTIRRWEKKGLIKASRDSRNYRIFDSDEIERLMNKIRGCSVNNYKVLKSESKTSFNAIELFAGAGGTALGMENAGINHVLLNEINKDAAETLRLNFPNSLILFINLSISSLSKIL